MQKNNLVDIISKRTGVRKIFVRKVMKSFLETVGEELKNGKEIKIVGFGSFSKCKRAARVFKSHFSGENVEVPERYTVSFKAGKVLKDTVNE